MKEAYSVWSIEVRKAELWKTLGKKKDVQFLDQGAVVWITVSLGKCWSQVCFKVSQFAVLDCENFASVDFEKVLSGHCTTAVWRKVVDRGQHVVERFLLKVSGLGSFVVSGVSLDELFFEPDHGLFCTVFEGRI